MIPSDNDDEEEVFKGTESTDVIEEDYQEEAPEMQVPTTMYFISNIGKVWWWSMEKLPVVVYDNDEKIR